jgi:hypothetical protein
MCGRVAIDACAAQGFRRADGAGCAEYQARLAFLVAITVKLFVH